MADTREVIDTAMRSQGQVWIVYRDYNRNVTERMVTPLEWESYDKFRAYCHWRQAERHFRLFNILRCETVGSGHGQPSSPGPRTSEATFESSIEIPLVRLVENRSVQKRAKRTDTSSEKKTEGPPFSRVGDGDQWSRLLRYLVECLVQENRQQYVIPQGPDSVYFVGMDSGQVRGFLDRGTRLEFLRIHRGESTPFARFVQPKLRQQHQCLCMGYPSLVLESGDIAPLIIAPVTLEEEKDEFLLYADDPEPSYAAFSSLGLDREEIAFVLSKCAKVQPTSGRSLVEAWQELLVGEISEALGHPLASISWKGGHLPPPRPGAVYEVPCLFWVRDNVATANLITELRALSQSSQWDVTPDALRVLLSEVPPHEYPAAVPLDQDDSIYVTQVNERQRQAIAAILREKLTVVTGPPGTGKSQLVLNLIAQAVLCDQSVLFASRNNRAVDVVMSRLHDELNFPGAVRTGSRANRQKAALQMKRALDQVSTVQQLPLLQPLREKYLGAKAQVAEAQVLLHRIREIGGLVDSHEKERAHLVELLPRPVVKLAEDHPLQYRREELDHLSNVISALLMMALRLQDEKEEIERTLSVLIEGKTGDAAFWMALEQFEQQWGSFGGGLLHRRSFDRLEALRDYVQTWLDLLPALVCQNEITLLADSYSEMSTTYAQGCEDLSAGLRMQLDQTADRLEPEAFSLLVRRATELARYAESVVKGRLPLWQKALVWLGLKDPRCEISEPFTSLQRDLSIEWENEVSSELPLLQIANECFRLARFLNGCHLKQRITQTRASIERARQQLRERLDGLPESIRGDLEKVKIRSMDQASLDATMRSILDQTNAVIEQRDQLVGRVNAKLDGNEDALHTLDEFKATSAGKDRHLWTLRVPVWLSVIISHLAQWRNLAALWATDEALRYLWQQVGELPSEPETVKKVRRLIQERDRLGADILRTHWLQRAKSLDTSVIQQAYDYVSAFEQLASDGYSGAFAHLRSTQDRYASSALQVFPAWATTNLAARSNFPLSAGLFDLVIIDEASQCDMASALPLLYRAQRIVVVGDPNQLRHVATLHKESDYKAALRFGVAPDALLYGEHSLFDLGQRSVGVQPGRLLLREHYRSVPRIVQFSNQAFYDNELIVRTDLSRQEIPSELVKSASGVFWLQVDGTAERPPDGSAFNQAELQAVEMLVPRLLARMAEKGASHVNLGIVTPYREQANRIQIWVSDRYGDDNRILVGTAHTFQGNERHIMIFSPVLAPGLPEGSLHWLEQTYHLLNVSVTRAQLTLIVVGHFDYCQSLPADSVYHRLADYVADVPGCVVRAIDELPLFGEKPLEIVGTLLDPENPEHNRLTLRRFLESCRDYVWWCDRYFQDQVFDLLWDVVQCPDLDLGDIRLLAAVEQARSSDRSSPRLHLDRARTLRNELGRRGVNFEIGLLPKNELPHDRYLYSRGHAINMPPFGGAYGEHKHVSEYTPSSTDPSFFEDYWARATKLDAAKT